jgi:periplasmic protein TonB
MVETLIPSKAAGSGRGRKGMILFLSLVLHAAAISGIVVVPLLRAEAELPGFKVITAALVAPPVLPGVPPGGRPGRPTKGPGKPGDLPKNPPPISGPIKLRAPINVPTTIEDDDPTAGIPGETGGPGVEGAPDEGTGPWQLGEPLPAENPDATAAPPTPVRPPKLIKRVSPAYPQVPLMARIPGMVVIEASTDMYGLVKEVRVISGNPLFHEAALAAVRQWRYEPYVVNGIPRPVRFTVTITFTLETR